MKHSRTCLALLALLAAAWGSPVAAQWKWRDAQGQVKYSDLPPPAGVPERDVLQRPNPTRLAEAPVPAPSASAPSAAASKAPAVDAGLESRRQAQEQALEARRRAEEQKALKELVQQCAQAREHLHRLESGERMVRTTASGERQVLDDTLRAQEVARVRKTVARHCR